MKTIVRYQRAAKDSLDSWLDSVAGVEPLRQFMREVYVAEIKRQLRATAGRPEGVIEEKGIEPPILWWEFLPGVWIQYCVQTKGWFRQQQFITILGIWDENQ